MSVGAEGKTRRTLAEATPCESIPQSAFLRYRQPTGSIQRPRQNAATSKNAQRTSDRFNAYSKKEKMKMSDDSHSDQYQSKYIASREASFFNRHRRCIRSSFGAYFVAHTHL
jgi:hypothetical protein